MFFDQKWVNNKSLKKAWLASHGYIIEDEESVDYGDLTSKILEKVNESKSKKQARLSLRTSAVLVNGVARLHMADTEKLLHDCELLDEALKNRNRKPSSSNIGINTSMEEDSYCELLDETLKNRNREPSSSKIENNTSMEKDSYCELLDETLKNRNREPSSSKINNTSMEKDSCNTNSKEGRNSTKESTSGVANTSNIATTEVAVQTDRSYLSKMAVPNSMCYIQVHDSNGLLKRIICCPANSHALDTLVNN
ncbi:unnamed protein product [Colias eurytheme]|nr:unnamed protein product [Colias eurytheme]